MFTLKAENAAGQQITLTPNAAYTVYDISGLEPPDATINLTQYASIDGGRYDSAKIPERQITITLAVNAPAETNRIALYQYLQTKAFVRLYITNGTRNVYIDGYVKSMPINYFDKKQTVQVVVACPMPYFLATQKDTYTCEVDDEIGMINVINYGDTEVGAVIRAYRKRSASGAPVSPLIENLTTGKQMTISAVISPGGTTVDTRRGQRYASISVMGEGWSWLTFVPGQNIVQVTADENPNSLAVSFELQRIYGGI